MGDEYITWALSVYAEKQVSTGHTVTHWPLSRSARSAAEAKGMGFEWLEENYPTSDGWKGYHITVIPVFKEDHDKLIARGEATQ